MSKLMDLALLMRSLHQPQLNLNRMNCSSLYQQENAIANGNGQSLQQQLLYRLLLLRQNQQVLPIRLGTRVFDESCTQSPSIQQSVETTKIRVEENQPTNKKRSRHEKSETYKCSCNKKYSKVWKVNQRVSVKICMECKKGVFVVYCTPNKSCNTCKRRLNHNPCEISLKFRRCILDNFESTVNNMQFLQVHVFQNVFDRFNVIASTKQTKRQRLLGENSLPKQQDERAINRVRENIQSIIGNNQHTLPFTCEELKNMKLIVTSQEKEKGKELMNQDNKASS